MEAPNMASITALEQSFQNCSLNRSNGSGLRTSSEEEDTSLELNSHLSLPYQWEQCLDLKTGEIYYINWENGMKRKDDPRKITSRESCYYSEEDNNSNNNTNSYDSDDGSSSASSPSPLNDGQEEEEEHYNNTNSQEGGGGDHILVVAGCKTCMMYFMLPKRVEECPKCNGFLLHFDRLENEDGSF
ncbi:Atp-dependent rna helicase [Thalictrum thalictroides]|uniref:Atp-dependent rna helicase n=1 Tax=Thalictrum thalictroides TaxID=46969 RepID=A0A7J6XAM2_THATH|nr:Atp-dependent rna helicase [Thalictrum thalictroides]